MIKRRCFTVLLVVAFGAPECRSSTNKLEGRGQGSASVPVSSGRSVGEAVASSGPQLDRGCEASKHRKALRAPFYLPGQIVARDGIEGHCLGEPADEEVIKAANGCEAREKWQLCRLKPQIDLYYDKDWRLDVIRVHRDYRWPDQHHPPPRTPDGVGPGMSPDNVAWNWGLPLHAERVKDPDFGLLEIRYYAGIALEIERSAKRPPIIGGVYVFKSGFPRLAPLANPATDAGPIR